MKKYLANMVTATRIICGIWMLCTLVFSVSFYTAYLLGGFTDMIDGTIARKMNTASVFGEKLDSVADFVFMAAACGKIIPVVEIPVWLGIGILLVLLLRIRNMIRRKAFVLRHTVANKFTGFLLFLLPLTLPFVELKYSGGTVCILAAVSAVLENRCIAED